MPRTEKKIDKKNVSRKGGMLGINSRFRVPTNTSLGPKRKFNQNDLNTILPFKFNRNIDWNKTIKIPPYINKMINQQVALLNAALEKTGFSVNKEEYKKVIGSVVYSIISEQTGGSITRVEKFSRGKQITSLMGAILFAVGIIICIYVFIVSCRDIIHVDITAFVKGQTVSEELKETLCDAFNAKDNEMNLSWLSKIWYAVSVTVSNKSEWVLSTEIKIINIIDKVIRDVIVGTAETSYQTCVSSSKTKFDMIVNGIAGLWTGAGKCMETVASAKLKNDKANLEYISTLLYSYITQKGTNVVSLPFVSLGFYASYQYLSNSYLHQLELYRLENPTHLLIENGIENNNDASTSNALVPIQASDIVPVSVGKSNTGSPKSRNPMAVSSLEIPWDKKKKII
jgi:hypothetical protein